MNCIELVGQILTVTNSSNSNLIGLEGKVLLETKNTIKIETKNITKTIIKKTIKFTINKNPTIHNGSEFVGSGIERKGAK